VKSTMHLQLLIRIRMDGALQPLSHAFILSKWDLPSLLVEEQTTAISNGWNQPLSTCSIKKKNYEFWKHYISSTNAQKEPNSWLQRINLPTEKL